MIGPKSREAYNSNGEPLPGATVRILENNVVTVTNQDGIFTFSHTPEQGNLIISFIGFQTEKFPFVNPSKFPLVFQLKSNPSSLNEVQIIGYGQTTRRLNTGNVSTISAKDLEEQPVTNPLAAIQGRAPGVLVQTQNGLPGGNISIQIRGQGSIASGTDPLYIIDGVPFLSAPIYGMGIATGANGPISPFSSLNPDDIASISILKDADATAIYGSRAANGVILITTKKGTAGRSDFTIDVNQGINRISRLNSYLNLSQYLKLRKEAFQNDGVVATPDVAPDLLVWDTTRSTDWQKYFYGHSAPVTNVQASLSGGDENNRYLSSFNYHREGTILPGNESYLKGGGYLSLDHSSADKKFNTVISMSYSRDDNHTLYSFGNSAGTLPPNFPVYNPDGSYNWSIDSNPVASLGQKQHSESSYLNIGDVLKYTFFSGFDARVSLGYNSYTLSQTATLPAWSQDINYSPIDVAYFAENSSSRYIIEPQLNYVHHFKNSTLTALLGGTYQYTTGKGFSLEGDGVNNPSLLGNMGAANSITNQANTGTTYKYESVFARLNYSWKQKYLLDLNARRDGSTRFGPGKQFGNFYAVGAGWIFSEERIFKELIPALSFGKIRSSYGLTGNDQIPDYQFLSTYRSGSVYDGMSSLTPARLANPNYSWETTKKLEVAVELGWFKDRLVLSGDWYRNNSSNQLIAYTVPYITGFSSYQANFPAVIQNTGWEFELTAQPVKAKSLTWSTTFNLTVPKNKLVSFPSIATSSYANTYVVGQDLSILKSYQFIGVNPQTGLAQFKDLNNDGRIAFPADVIVEGKTSPDLFGGWGNSFTYGQIQLDFFFEFVKRKYPGYIPSLGSSPINDPAFVLGRWEKPGDATSIPRATIDPNNLGNYSLSQFSDASYIRFKNLSLSYLFKASLLQKWKIKQLRLYIQGENLFVLANKNRFDPEISATGAIPPLRTITAGFKLSL